MEITQGSSLERRVYARELRERLGFGETWFRQLQRRGVIPAGRRDPGGKRVWYTFTEAQAIIEGMKQGAQPAATSSTLPSQ